MATKNKTTAPATEEHVTLGNLQPLPGSVKKKLRVGRGRASGAGKTSNRGHNGEGQRSGQSRKRGFEGGQMPLYRRVPKFRTFPQPNKRVWLELNVSDVPGLLADGQKELTYTHLASLGLLRKHHDGVRLLGKGDIAVKVSVQAHYATPGAREKLEKAGGKVLLVEGPMAPLLQ